MARDGTARQARRRNGPPRGHAYSSLRRRIWRSGGKKACSCSYQKHRLGGIASRAGRKEFWSVVDLDDNLAVDPSALLLLLLFLRLCFSARAALERPSRISAAVVVVEDASTASWSRSDSTSASSGELLPIGRTT